MTPLPPRRRQHPLHLEGAWLLTASPDGDRQVPGMSVVADPKGFTLSGPDPGNERTIPWEQTTGFTCQRPARLLDGSPATVLEVGLANGRVLELLLPVTRVPPSETVVVETELAVMAEQYGGQKPGTEQAQAQSQAQARASVPVPPQALPVQAPPVQAAPAQAAPTQASSNGQSPLDAPNQQPRPNGSEPHQRTREQLPALALQGAHTNGSSTKASSTLATEAPAPAAAPAAQAAPAAPAAPAARPAPVAEPVSVDAAADTASAPAAVAAEVPAAPAVAAEPAPVPVKTTRRKAKDEVEVAARPADQDDDSQSSSVERRENRMMTLLVALIGIVVVVLIAELVLILFVLNHNPSTKGESVGSQTTTLVYYPSSIARRYA